MMPQERLEGFPQSAVRRVFTPVRSHDDEVESVLRRVPGYGARWIVGEDHSGLRKTSAVWLQRIVETSGQVGTLGSLRPCTVLGRLCMRWRPGDEQDPDVTADRLAELHRDPECVLSFPRAVVGDEDAAEGTSSPEDGSCRHVTLPNRACSRIKFLPPVKDPASVERSDHCKGDDERREHVGDVGVQRA